MSISVSTTPANFTSTSSKFVIDNVRCKLGFGAYIDIRILDDNDSTIMRRTLIMQGADYNNWLDDDQYCINWCAVQLGMTVQSYENI